MYSLLAMSARVHAVDVYDLKRTQQDSCNTLSLFCRCQPSADLHGCLHLPLFPLLAPRLCAASGWHKANWGPKPCRLSDGSSTNCSLNDGVDCSANCSADASVNFSTNCSANRGVNCSTDSSANCSADSSTNSSICLASILPPT